MNICTRINVTYVRGSILFLLIEGFFYFHRGSEIKISKFLKIRIFELDFISFIFFSFFYNEIIEY